jgi:hypothetical protein
MPNVCKYGDEEFHRFNDDTRESFSNTLEIRLKEEAVNLQA